jgi:hypothetical protein
MRVNSQLVKQFPLLPFDECKFGDDFNNGSLSDVDFHYTTMQDTGCALSDL